MAERLKDQNWTFIRRPSGQYSNEHAMIATLMDLRDELKQLNRVFACHNFQTMPATLRKIARHTAPRVRYKRVKR